MLRRTTRGMTAGMTRRGVGVPGVTSWWEKTITPNTTEQNATLFYCPHDAVLSDANFREIRWVVNGFGYAARIRDAGLVGVYEGDAYGAKYLSLTADRLSGITGKTTAVNKTYYDLTNSAWTLEWDVTPGFSATKIGLYVYQGSTNGVLEIYRVRDAVATLAVSIDLNDAGNQGPEYEYLLDSSVPFEDGDILRLKRATGETDRCRIHSVVLCADTAPTGSQEVFIRNRELIVNTGSSIEWAYSGAPDGESASFFGNIAHQSPFTEENRILGFTVDSDAKTTQGVYTGVVRCTREADIDFDGTNRYFASYEMEYRAVRSGLRIYHKVTFSELTDINTTYIAMVSTPYALTTEVNAGGVSRDIGIGNTTTQVNLGQGVTQGQIASTSKGNLIAAVVSQSTNASVVSANTGTGNKLYLNLGSASYDTGEFVEEAWVMVLGLPR